MGRRKQYGESRVDRCPFCGKRATLKNPQGVPVCREHKRKQLENMKCACGNWLEVREGKWGPFFHCFDCGNVSFSRGLELNPQGEEDKEEITVTADEVDFI